MTSTIEIWAVVDPETREIHTFGGSEVVLYTNKADATKALGFAKQLQGGERLQAIKLETPPTARPYTCGNVVKVKVVCGMEESNDQLR
jgi:hypothetical protein